MAQIIDFKNPRAVKDTAKGVVEKTRLANEERKGMFEQLMVEVEKVNPELGGFEEVAALLALPEDQFMLIAPIFLEELEKSLNNVEDKLLLVQAMNVSGTKLEDLRESYMKLAEAIDTQYAEIISAPKRDFLKRMVGATYNCIAETESISKRIVNVPIELTSEYAKLPTYAHLGDGAVDLYSPADYVIKPGETVLIPCDIKVALPYGYAFLIHPRSGTSLKTKLRVANSIGLIDSQYKGVIGVIMENVDAPIKDIEYDFNEDGQPIIKSIAHGTTYYINKGERFAQMRLVEVPTANFLQVESVDGIGDDRGGGFGSSGVN